MHVSDRFSVHHQESSTVWHIPIAVCTVLDSDDGQKTCPKHVEFYHKNKFEKLVHFFGFIIRTYHDARSSECHIDKIVPITNLNKWVQETKIKLR